jgi:hypothetical protein
VVDLVKLLIIIMRLFDAVSLDKYRCVMLDVRLARLC